MTKVISMFWKRNALFCFAAAALAGVITVPGSAQTSAPQHAHSTTLRRSARGYLGVGVVDLTEDRVKALKLKDDQGVEVKRVDETSPAAKAGLKENDVIL